MLSALASLPSSIRFHGSSASEGKHLLPRQPRGAVLFPGSLPRSSPCPKAAVSMTGEPVAMKAGGPRGQWRPSRGRTLTRYPIWLSYFPSTAVAMPLPGALPVGAGLTLLSREPDLGAAQKSRSQFFVTPGPTEVAHSPPPHAKAGAPLGISVLGLPKQTPTLGRGGMTDAHSPPLPEAGRLRSGCGQRWLLLSL